MTYDGLATQREASHRDYRSANAQVSDVDDVLQQLTRDCDLPEVTADLGCDTSLTCRRAREKSRT